MYIIHIQIVSIKNIYVQALVWGRNWCYFCNAVRSSSSQQTTPLKVLLEHGCLECNYRMPTAQSENGFFCQWSHEYKHYDFNEVNVQEIRLWKQLSQAKFLLQCLSHMPC